MNPHVHERTASDHPADIIDACRRQEPAALDRVFRAEAPYLERVLSRIIGPGADLEDILQMTLEAAIRAFPAFRGEASARTWLTRIAVRTALTHLKHPAQKRRASLELVEGGVSTDDGPPRLGDQVDARGRLRLLYEHLERIDPKQRTAFVLFAVEGHSMEEVAALMGARISATKSRVMWARRRLFARLAKDPRAKDWLADYLGASS